MKIAIAGCGKVGAALAEQLCKEKHDVTIIDIDEERMSYVSNSQDVFCYVGDARSVAVLKAAGVEGSDCLLAMTSNDDGNLMICLIARTLGIKNTIARVRNPIYRETLGLIKNDLGLSMAINPELEAAREMFNTLCFKSAIQVERFVKSKNEILTCVIREGMPICNIKIKDLHNIVKAKVLICALKRDGEIFIPNGETEIKANDTLSFVSSHLDAEKFFKKMGNETGKAKNLTVIGGGMLGYNLGRLAIENAMPVKIVDMNNEVCKRLNVALPSAEIICGDATSIDLMEEEEILNSDAIAVVTGEDSINLMISMFLSKNAPNAKVITKIKKTDFEDLLYNTNVGNVFNPKYITADHVLQYVRALQNAQENEVQSLCHVIDNKVEVLEFLIKQDAKFLGKPIKNLKFKKNLLLTNITRQGVSFIPNGDDTIEAGDTVLVITTTLGFYRIEDIFA